MVADPATRGHMRKGEMKRKVRNHLCRTYKEEIDINTRSKKGGIPRKLALLHTYLKLNLLAEECPFGVVRWKRGIAQAFFPLRDDHTRTGG